MPLSDADISYLDSELGSPDNLGPSMTEAVKHDPDKYAKELDVAASNGVPVDTARRRALKFEYSDKVNAMDLDDIRENNPHLTEYLSNPDNAAVSSDDVDNLKAFEQLLTNYKRPWYEWRFDEAHEGLGESTLESTKQGGHSLGMGLLDAAETMVEPLNEEAARRKAIEPGLKTIVYDDADTMNRLIWSGIQKSIVDWFVGDDESADVNDPEYVEKTRAGLIESYKKSEERIKELTPKDLSIVEEGYRGGLQSIMRNAPGLAATMATRNPAYMLSLMTGQVGAESYGKGRAAGLSKGESAAFGAEQALIEFGTEIIPATKFVDMIGGGQTLKKMMGFALSEIGGEQLATAGQSISEFAHGLDKQMDAAHEAGDYDKMVEIQLHRQYVTFWAALTGSGLQTGALTGVNHLMGAADRKIADSQERVGQTMHDQSTLDVAIELAQSNLTGTRSPERYGEFLNAVGADTPVLIPGEVLEGIEGLPEYIVPGDGDVEVSMELFMKDIATNPELMAQLRPHLKLNPAAMTQLEMEEDDQADIRRVLEKAAASVETRTQAEKIFDDVKDQLVATGRQSEATARLSAQLIPAQAAAMVDRLKREKGVDVSLEEVYEKMGFKVRGPQQADEVQDTTLEQQVESALSSSDIEIDEEIQNEETGEVGTAPASASELFQESKTRLDALTEFQRCIGS